MKKRILFLSLALAVLYSCGNKSTIKNDVKARTLADAYGDGTYIYPELLLPLTDISEVPSQVPNVGPVLSGIVRSIMNLGVGLSLSDGGKINMSMVQPLPEIPREYVKDVRLKRVFFYIEPKEGEVRKRKCYIDFLCGRSDVDFDFLGKMAIIVSSHHLDRREGWSPLLSTGNKPTKKMQEKLEGLFAKRAPIFPEFVDPRTSPDLLLLKYDQSRTDRQGNNEYLRNTDYGVMFIAKAKRPYWVKQFLLNHRDLKGVFENLFVLEDTLVIELKKDPILKETFLAIYNQEKDMMDRNPNLTIGSMEECDVKTCLDLRVPDVSLIDIVTRDNAIKLDAFVEASEVPDTFKLKGFIQFKTKVRPPI